MAVKPPPTEVAKLPADDPKIAYMPPESGPFRCSHCSYFIRDNAPCGKVSDPIKAGGCCNKYLPEPEAESPGKAYRAK